MKSPSIQAAVAGVLSHPTRGAWIEIWRPWRCTRNTPLSHPTRGAWIEILAGAGAGAVGLGRTPHGVRGLKSADAVMVLSM